MRGIGASITWTVKAKSYGTKSCRLTGVRVPRMIALVFIYEDAVPYGKTHAIAKNVVAKTKAKPRRSRARGFLI